MIRGLLDDGHKISMAEVQKGYERIRQENNVTKPTISRKIIKNLLVDTINDIEFHQPKRVNEPALISSKELRDISIDSYEDGFFQNRMLNVFSKQRTYYEGQSWGLQNGNLKVVLQILMILKFHIYCRTFFDGY